MKREALKRRRIKTGEREEGGKKRKDQSGPLEEKIRERKARKEEKELEKTKSWSK